MNLLPITAKLLITPLNHMWIGALDFRILNLVASLAVVVNFKHVRFNSMYFRPLSLLILVSAAEV
jgi:hypothetical protein